jgi:hypothetical protein
MLQKQHTSITVKKIGKHKTTAFVVLIHQLLDDKSKIVKNKDILFSTWSCGGKRACYQFKTGLVQSSFHFLDIFRFQVESYDTVPNYTVS